MMNESEKAPRDMSDEELQDPAAWDFEGAEELPTPERKARAVVSVAFPADVFDYVAQAAERAGMKISHFIREAALEKAASATTVFNLDVKPAETEGFSISPDPEDVAIAV